MAEGGKLAWIDMEMTGLDPDSCAVLEVACLVTDGDLEVVAEGPVLAVRPPPEAVAAMDDWNRKHHGESGLLERVSREGVAPAEAEARTLEFLAAHLKPKESPLCGNSVWQDRRFLVRHMPKLEAFFHYRLIDVSTVKELAKRWYPDLPEFSKRKVHRALDDIRESVAELKYYREKIFKR